MPAFRRACSTGCTSLAVMMKSPSTAANSSLPEKAAQVVSPVEPPIFTWCMLPSLQITPLVLLGRFGFGHLRHLLFSAPPLRCHGFHFHGGAEGDSIQPVGEPLPRLDGRRFSGEDQKGRLKSVLGVVVIAGDTAAFRASECNLPRAGEKAQSRGPGGPPSRCPEDRSIAPAHCDAAGQLLCFCGPGNQF